MPLDAIVVRGAREHNLKNIDVTIPRDQLVVITGLSGSGKSSLAFDTIYAEGQRRYVESLSAYARQFLGQMEKPDVDYIEGLSPAISIDQKGASRNPRSTVGTVTEIYDYLRLLFARAGRPHCPNCGRPIEAQTVQQIVDAILDIARGQAADDPRARDPGPQGRASAASSRTRAAPASCACASTARSTTSKRRSPSTATRTTPSRSSSTVSSPRAGLRARRDGRRGHSTASSTSRLADSVETALKLGGGVMLRRYRTARRSGCTPSTSPAPSTALLRRAGAAQLQLQQPPRRLPGLHRPRRQDGDRPGAGHPEQEPLAVRGRRCCPGRAPHDQHLVHPHAGGRRQEARLQHRHARARPEAKPSWTSSSTATRSRSPSATAAPAATPTSGTRSTRASSPTCSAATRRPTPTTCAPRSSATWRRCPARPARARASSPRRAPSPSATRTSPRRPA